MLELAKADAARPPVSHDEHALIELGNLDRKLNNK
jgi:hypothetical protein